MTLLFNWISRVLLFLMGAAVLFSLIVRAFYVPDRPMFQTVSPSEFLILFAIFCALIFIIYSSRKINFKNGFIISVCITLTVQIAFILLYPLKPFSDMGELYRIAIRFHTGAFYESFEKGRYLASFPNNMYYTLLLSTIYKVFPHSIIVGKLINTISSIIIVYCTARIYKEIFGERCIGGLFILLSLFPPFILYSNHMYNDIISIAFFTAATLFLILGLHRQKVFYIILAFILLILGDLLRQIGIIFFIAFLIVLLLVAHKRGFDMKTTWTIIGLSILAYTITKPILNFLLVIMSIIPSDFNKYNMPVSAWLHIGFDFQTLGFQNGGKSFTIFSQLDHDAEKATIVYQNEIVQTFKNSSFFEILKFFAKKFLWTWTEGTYQMDRYGFGYENSVQYETAFTKLISSNPQIRNLITLFTHYYNTVILYFAALGVYIIKQKKYHHTLIFLLVIIGTMSFYCLWEIKSRYIFIAFPFLFIYFYYGLLWSISRLPNKSKFQMKKSIKQTH